MRLPSQRRRPQPRQPRIVPVDAAAANPGEGLVLEVSARRDCWVSISSDGQKQWQGTLLADRSRRVQAKNSFELTIGDAGAVTLALNGKPLAPVGKAGEVRKLTISAKGVAATAAPAPAVP